ncbi:MAG: hypothetical protein IPM22_00645 [Betaproteobacteria bacterium]|nr:hypothetical protein [Betaproteobacteria bacterium]MCC7218336.1 hypothetical protein [Burkholderiales bacterium]
MEPHWLVRPRTIRLLWAAFAAVLAATVAAEFFVPMPAHEGLAGTFAFGAWFGFAACAALILVAKALGVFLKRPDDYYDEARDD